MRTFRRGFSLVELMVVVGIIAVLAGVLFASFGGATESARATQCLTNLRSLAQAANAAALTNNYPTAGSVEFWNVKDGQEIYWEEPGWISWLSDGHYGTDGSGKAHSHQNNPLFPFYGTGNDDDAEYALTHGSLWFCCNRNRKLYTCPEHVRYRSQQGMKAPVFSYVMNATFGWDTSEGTDAQAGGKGASVAKKYGQLGRADRTLMFAELPTVDVDNNLQAVKDGSGLGADAVLHYLKTPNDETGLASESGKAESIGFNHKVNGKTPCAHVVFADCHTEKIVWRAGGLDSKKLTAYLCRGVDLVLNSSRGWEVAEGADDED